MRYSIQMRAIMPCQYHPAISESTYYGDRGRIWKSSGTTRREKQGIESIDWLVCDR